METRIGEPEEEILAACSRALRLAPSTLPPTLPPSPELLGTPEWYSFEQEAWPIGEGIRHSFLRNPHLKKNSAAVAKVLEVVRCRNLRRGRQSFVLALGFASARPYASELVPFLTDPDINGQVVHTLIKMKAAGFSQAVTPLLRSEKTWIRRLARKYTERYPRASGG